MLDGRLVEGGGEGVLVVHEPATGAVLATGTPAGSRDVDAALRAARRAQEKAWGRAPGMARTRHLLALARRLEAQADVLATLEARDTGTPRTQVLARDLPAAHTLLQHHAGWSDKLVHLSPGPEPRALGVSVHLLPPVASVLDVLAGVAAALAAGCTVVVLAPAESPLAALELGRLALEAGLPAGVLTVLAGPVALELLQHKELDVVTVTGPPAGTAAVARTLVGSGVPVRPRVHGEQVVVALGPAAVGEAVGLAVDGVRAHARRLGSGLHLLVPVAALDAAAERADRALGRLVVGNPLEAATDVGPTRTGGLVAPVLDRDGPVVGDRAAGPVLQLRGSADDDDLVARAGGDPHARIRLVGGAASRRDELAHRLRGRLDDAPTLPTTPREYLRG